ncbi:MAG: Asp/Glu racemase [Tissierellia bacterium]|nr:Asp/Glu racemase [Tissierellia bacterium]
MKDISYGTRGKIGLIYPAPGWVMEPEFYEMSPEGVITCTTRIPLLETNKEQLSLLGDYAIEASKLLSQAPVDVMVLGCTSGSFIGGKEYEDKLIKKMEKATEGISCITTSGAVVEALDSMNLKKIAVATPYIQEVNSRGKMYLEENGFEITKFIGMNLLYDKDIDSQSFDTVYKLAKEADTEDAEAVVILCTGLRTIGVLEHLEKDLGKPVISAIQATFWHSLKNIGINEKIKGFGSLLEK